MPLQVHGEQRLLHDILNILDRRAIAQEGLPRGPAQNRREQPQQIAIRVSVAAVGGPHQLVKFRLPQRHVLVPYSDAVGPPLHIWQKNPREHKAVTSVTPKVVSAKLPCVVVTGSEGIA